MPDKYREAAEIIRNADALVICAGAGMGVDSGLPDFRGNEGFWKAYPPYAKKGLGFTDMATPEWFERDAAFAWGFYGHRLSLYRDTVPHEGFAVLNAWAHAARFGAYVFSSNVDGQFQKAGFVPERVVEVHGSIHWLQETGNRDGEVLPAADYHVEVDPETMRALPPLPHHPRSHTLLRPNILMFRDWEWNPTRVDAQIAGYEQWLRGLYGASIAVVECGAGSAVPTVRRHSEQLVSRYDARLIRINTREHDVPAGELSFDVGAREGLSGINAHVRR